MSDKDKRVGWLRELKVGDEVGISWGGADRTAGDIALSKVEKITPSGGLQVEHVHSRFSPEGYGPKPFGGRNMLIEVTPELRARIERRGMEYEARSLAGDVTREEIENATDEDLSALIAAIKRVKGEA